MNRPSILLIAPGAFRHQWGAIVRLPISLLSLSAWLLDHGRDVYEIRIWDMRVEKAICEDEIEKVHIIGISAMTGSQIYYGLQAVARIRKINKHAKIIWGGIHPTLVPEQTICHELVDAVVVGEGEETFREIVECVLADKSLAGIPGTIVKNRNGGVIKGDPRPLLNMENIPLHAYNLIDIKLYKGISNQFDYQSSRGCPFRCDFCYNLVFCNSKWRSKSAKKVVNELSELYRMYSVSNIALVDDEFFINIKRVEDILDGIIKSGLPIKFTASCRLDIARKFSKEFLIKLKSVGIQHLYFGAESGSNKILKEIHKGITTEDIFEGACHVARYDIRPILSFMSGFPEETFEQFMETLEFIRKLYTAHPLITVNGIFPYSPYPGTATFRASVDKGLHVPTCLEEWGKWDFQYKPDNPWLTSKKIKCMQIAFYIVRFRYYLIIFYSREPSLWKRALLNFILFPFILSARIRLAKKWFGWAVEWQLFALIAKRSFGYL